MRKSEHDQAQRLQRGDYSSYNIYTLTNIHGHKILNPTEPYLKFTYGLQDIVCSITVASIHTANMCHQMFVVTHISILVHVHTYTITGQQGAP